MLVHACKIRTSINLPPRTTLREIYKIIPCMHMRMSQPASRAGRADQEDHSTRDDDETDPISHELVSPKRRGTS